MARRKNLVLTKGDGESGIVVQTNDDHPYAGITKDEWSAANCRLLSHMLRSGQLQNADIHYYLAYTTQIHELAQRYEWECILDFDYAYRERQAELQFPWGSHLESMELHMLTQQRFNQNRPNVNHRKQQSSVRPHVAHGNKELCRLFFVS